MSIVGYLRTQGIPNARLRFVKPGNSADDPSVPANAVIFDSNANEYSQVLYSGTYAAASGISTTKVVSWPDLGYIPFAWMGHRVSIGGVYQYFIPVALAASNNAGFASVNSDGIYARFDGFASFFSGIFPVYLDYIVFKKHT